MTAKVAHFGFATGLHMSLYNPAATFAHLLCLHNLRERLNERDRKKGKGGNDRGRKRERQLMNEEGGAWRAGGLKKWMKGKGREARGKGEMATGHGFS